METSQTESLVGHKQERWKYIKVFLVGPVTEVVGIVEATLVMSGLLWRLELLQPLSPFCLHWDVTSGQMGWRAW